jgi:long-subunit fatty acid transport protein
VPLGPVGFGAAVHGSYLRTGNTEPDSPQRFFSIRSAISLLEGDVTMSIRPLDALSFGAGVRVGVFSYESVKATDLAATLNPSLAPDPLLPVGDPLLEGTQTIGPLSQLTASWLVGATLHLERAQIDLSFRPAWRTTMSGPVQLVPSNVLTTQIDGNVEIELGVPAHLLLASRVQVHDRWILIPEVEWVGWAPSSRATATVSGLQLTSSDPLLNSVLGASGLSEADFLASSEGTQDNDLQWHDVFNGSMQVLYLPAEAWEVRGGLGLAPGAVPDQWVTPANLDFTSIVVSAGARWWPAPALGVALSGQRYQTVTRTITTSPYSMTDPPEGLGIFPSGNGRYALSLWRVGLGLQLMIPSRSES